MKYFIKTFGCQMNYSDSERIAGFLETEKYRKAEKIESANLVIFNTCGIRQAAEDRALSIIHSLRSKKNEETCLPARQGSKQYIILTGCLANRKDIQKKLKNKVDLFCEIKDFPNKINILLNSYFLLHTSSCNNKSSQYLNIKPNYTNSYSANIPIMTGCNNFCAYCVVPYARGREVSRPAEEILTEIKNLVKNGYKEMTLLGQNVNSYCYSSKLKHKAPKTNLASALDSRLRGNNKNITTFPELLHLIEKIPGHFWIRFISSHPKEFSDELIETVAQSKKVCEHIHLPVQAGSDEILQKMNRKYTAKYYLELIKKIRSAFKKYKPDALYSITSDIIVGFPGETKKQFMESAKIMKKVKYDLVYFGQFSPRPETAAWKMKDNVSRKEKTRREKFLNEILKKTSLENNKKYKNTAQEVLVEKTLSPFSKGRAGEGFEKLNKMQSSRIPLNAPFPKGEVIYFGKTRSGKNVKILSAKNNLVGKFVEVKITKANIWNLEGELGK